MNRIYTGIGSRSIPESEHHKIEFVATNLAKAGYTLRSGGADGCDTLFEEHHAPESKEIFLPWRGFNKRSGEGVIAEPTLMAEALSCHHWNEYHLRNSDVPTWDSLKRSTQKLMSRNVHQVMGVGLLTRSDFVICWTPDGVNEGKKTDKKTGGTGHAIRIASYFRVQVFNLNNEDDWERIKNSTWS